MWKWNMRNGYRLLHTTEYLDEICKKYQFPSNFTCLCFACGWTASLMIKRVYSLSESRYFF